MKYFTEQGQELHGNQLPVQNVTKFYL